MIVKEIEDLIAPELITHFSKKWCYSYLIIHQLFINVTAHHNILYDNVNEKTKKQIHTALNHNLKHYKQLQQINTNNFFDEPWLIQDALLIKRILKTNSSWEKIKHIPIIQLTPTACEALNIIGLIVFILHKQKKK